MNTILTDEIESANNKKMYDQICKQLLANVIILAWIMKECAVEYKDFEVEEIASKYIEGIPDVSSINVRSGEKIAGTNTESSGINEGKITYDIRFPAIFPKGDEFIGLLFNIEAHNNYYPRYPIIKRGVYCSSRMISQQYGLDFPKADYNKVKKVYSIWLIRNNVPKKAENSITSYDIAETTQIGNTMQPKENYDLMTVILIHLSGDPEDKQSSDLLNLLNILLSEKLNASEKIKALEKDFRIPATEQFKSEVEKMCNLSEGIENIGIEKGVAMGIEQGLITTIVNMVKNLKLSLDDAIAAAEIPEDTRESYSMKIKELLQPS